MLSDARESRPTNRVKKGVIKKFFSEIAVFLVRKGSYGLRHLTYKDTKIREKKGKILKTWAMTEIFAVKMETRRQVSATAFHSVILRVFPAISVLI